jgi:hypothetical protein
MIALILLEKTTPDLISLFLPLLGILLLVFALNTVYEWLKTKPWKRVKLPDETEVNQIVDSQTGNEENNILKNDDDGQNRFTNTEPLTNPN